MARAAYQLALANPRVQSEVIEVNEFPELGERYGVRAVPLTVIADKVAIPGAVAEGVLVEQVVQAAQGKTGEAPEADGPTSQVAVEEPPIQRGSERESGLFIP